MRSPVPCFKLPPRLWAWLRPDPSAKPAAAVGTRSKRSRAKTAPRRHAAFLELP